MTEQLNARPTMLFWFISGAALIWNLFGMMIYVSQVSATPEQLAEAYRPEQVEFMLATPQWATAAFALAVTTGVLGCVLLLLRKSWALPVLIVSLAAVFLQNLNTFVLNDATALFGMVPVYIQSTIIVIGAGLIWYARYCKSHGWLD
jgi:hypothetical protein